MVVSASTVLDALGDSTRRSIVECLLGGALPVGELAERLPVSRPAVSQHLRVLKEARLVVETAVGTRRLYRIDPAGFAVVREYFDRFWTTTLDGFAALARTEAAAPSHTDPPGPDETEELT